MTRKLQRNSLQIIHLYQSDNIKRSLAISQKKSPEEVYHDELTLYDQLLDTEDRIEGINAFNNKNKPVFKG